VALWWDTCNRNFWRELEKIAGQFDTNVIIDNPALKLAPKALVRDIEFLVKYPPVDESFFYPRKKDIELSFMGQTSEYRSNRNEFLDFLANHGLLTVDSRHDRARQNTHDEYAEILGRTKISINFSGSVHAHQLKARVFEIILSGCMLLESENDQVSRLLKPYVHYIPFSTKEDLLRKATYYLRNSSERRRIAVVARDFVLENYSSTNFWQAILSSP